MKIQNRLILFLLLSLFIFSSCYKDSITFEIQIPEAIFNVSKNKPLVFTYKNEIYSILDNAKDKKKITSSGSIKTCVKRNHKFTKIAYLDEIGCPVIIDTLGNIINKLNNLSNSIFLEWSFNDSTLYIINNDSLILYGSSQNIPSIQVLGTNFRLKSVSINSNNDIAYSCKFNLGNNIYHRLYIHQLNGLIKYIEQNIVDFENLKWEINNNGVYYYSESNYDKIKGLYYWPISESNPSLFFSDCTGGFGFNSEQTRFIFIYSSESSNPDIAVKDIPSGLLRKITNNNYRTSVSVDWK